MSVRTYLYEKRKIILLSVLALGALVWCLIPERRHAFGIRMPAGYTVHGIDVSRYQGEVDWSDMENYTYGRNTVRIAFAFIKATEGRSVKDACFDRNWDSISLTNIIRGAYHFYVPSRSADEQANNFISTVTLNSGDLPPALDLEKPPGKQSRAAFRASVKIWLAKVEKHYGVKPIIYTNLGFYEKYLAGDSELESCPVWIARYNHRQDFGRPWVFWQHSEKGQIPGIRPTVDFNVFNGTLDELKSFCIK
ncbi:MAG: glycoside hydrolase family 25 protein [Prevotellaceae bacterium]|jgi:lysozyme|nr:glycoside hydrolase family 25 protein [Prevotellaceae bacterium]